MQTVHVRRLNESDSDWTAEFLRQRWGSTRIVSRGKVYEADTLPGLAALRDGKPAGLLTYRIEGDECEIVTIDSIAGGTGIGSALIGAIRDIAVLAECRRLWLITTNDNMEALRFYQKKGFVLVAVHCNALEHARKLKPEIPLVGKEGIPLRDEIELEMLL